MTRVEVARVFVVLVGLLMVGSLPLAAVGFSLATQAQPSCIDPESHVGTRGATDAALRYGQMREPDMGDADEAQLGPSGNGGSAFRASVPTYVHVISPDGVEGMVPIEKVREQVHVLTLGFSGSYGGFDAGFEFKLKAVDWTINPAWYAGPDPKSEVDMKQALHRGGTNALNIYLTTAGPYLGWSYFPKIVNTGKAYLDGIVIDWKSLPGMGYYPEFDLGYTAVHETGHWLNLYHTFQGGCKGHGDYVDDTPAEATPTFGCPLDKDTCTAPGADPVHNFMDYSDDPCYTQFTAGQADRMHDAWFTWRA